MIGDYFGLVGFINVFVFEYRELLISFRRATGQKPQRIIFYRHFKFPFSSASCLLFILLSLMMCLCRDGVSEGQFYQVLLYELDAIRKVTYTFVGILYLLLCLFMLALIDGSSLLNFSFSE